MPIELEKILTASASEYCSSRGMQSLSDYELRGVHVVVTDSNGDIHRSFAMAAPSEAEAVVDYRVNVAVAYARGHGDIYLITASGTALIPKNHPRGQRQ